MTRQSQDFSSGVGVGDPRVWTPAQLLATLTANAAPLVLDVRSRREFRRGHVPRAVHVPFWVIPSRLRGARDSRDVPVVVYCGHGPRAWMAGVVLRRHGFKHIGFLRGHMAGWRSARLPEEKTGP